MANTSFSDAPQTSGVPIMYVAVRPQDDAPLPDHCMGLVVQRDGRFAVRMKGDPTQIVVIAGITNQTLIGEFTEIRATGTASTFTDPFDANDPPPFLAMVAR